MEFLQPRDWSEALEQKPAHPNALPLAGGTDVMVDLNFGRERPEAILDLTRVREMDEWSEEDGHVLVGAGVSYARAIAELGDRLPGLAAASRTVGSPQIRNRGTIGGNLGSASPAGDALPPLYASDAEVELHSVSGGPADESTLRRFGDLVAEAAAPIDDVRGTAAYRRHALSVLARRSLAWAWREHVA